MFDPLHTSVMSFATGYKVSQDWMLAAKKVKN